MNLWWWTRKSSGHKRMLEWSLGGLWDFNTLKLLHKHSHRLRTCLLAGPELEHRSVISLSAPLPLSQNIMKLWFCFCCYFVGGFCLFFLFSEKRVSDQTKSVGFHTVNGDLGNKKQFTLVLIIFCSSHQFTIKLFKYSKLFVHVQLHSYWKKERLLATATKALSFVRSAPWLPSSQLYYQSEFQAPGVGEVNTFFFFFIY